MAESSLRVCAELFGFRAMGRISTYVEFVVKRWATARTALRRSIGFGNQASSGVGEISP